MRFFSTLAASFLGTLLGLGLLFVFGLMFLFALASTSEQAPTVRPGSLLVAELSGPYPEMVSGDPVAQAFGGEPALDLHDLSRAFRMAAVDTRIDGLWLKLGDVQASWASLEAIRRGVMEVRAAGKTVIATSDRYYLGEDELFLASAADSILLDPEALFEFNGFAMQMAFFKDLFDQAGINPQAVRAGRFKSAVEPYLRDSMSDDNREQLTALIQDIERVFVEALASGRDLEEADIRQLTQAGNIMTARQAAEAGLIDGLAYADEATAIFGDDPRTLAIKRYARSSSVAAGLPSGRDGEIAVLHATGTIVAGGRNSFPGSGSESIGSERFAEAIKRAREDSDVDAVVIRVNSPGGHAPAADAMLREIERTRLEKPVVVSMGDLAASGGYWIAASADTIVAERLTLTGSIGVFGLMLDLSGLVEDRIGITFDEVRTAPSADMMSGFRALSGAERAALEASVDQTYARFLEIVSDGRGLSIEEVDGLAQGRVWSGMQARDRGLVDVLGGLDTALALAAGRAGLAPGSYRVTEFPRPATFLERFTESLEARASVLVGARLQPTIPSSIAWIPEVLFDLVSTPAGVHARLPFALRVY